MRRTLALAGVLALANAFSLHATDPPHHFPAAIKGPCTECHKLHSAPGGTITAVAGNANLCQSCHVTGGQASAKPFATNDQALPPVGLPIGASPSGTSHRWDSGPAGHVKADPANTSTGSVRSTGMFTGRYAKTYTLTISTAGEVGTARFDWTATTPGGGSGTGVLTGTDAPLNEGVAVTFSAGTPPSFRLGDRYYVYVRTDLSAPGATAMALRLESGRIMCSTCHDQHSQAREPFDPAAPAYAGAGTGAGRHFQRLANDSAQMCKDCHAARSVASAAAGSHPVGVSVPVSGSYQSPSALPLGKPSGTVECPSCHQPHYAPAADGTLRRLIDTTSLCSDCHTLADTASPAKHVSGPLGALWPGGQYGTTFPAVTDSTKRGYCTNCHQPHGWPDTANTAKDYSSLLVDREESLCYTCHDGAPVVKNVRAQFQKTYRHPVEAYSGRHDPAEGGTATAYGGVNRHAECVDCHNAHQARGDAATPVAPAVSNRNRVVGGVAVTNGAAGTAPAFSYTASAANEYQICFKCHSSWTTQPVGQPNLAVKFNPNNPSYHPVEAAGKNLNIDANAFVNGWAATRTMYCADCHSSDDASVRGPHGSANAHILSRPYSDTTARLNNEMAATEVCFACHRFDTYGNRSASDATWQYSRFNPPAWDKGHAFHVGDRRYSCFVCHDSHGASTWPHLLKPRGTAPNGINSYTQTPTGGTCSPSCHGTETYTINYPR